MLFEHDFLIMTRQSCRLAILHMQASHYIDEPLPYKQISNGPQHYMVLNE